MKAYSIVVLVCEYCVENWEDSAPFDIENRGQYSCERCGKVLKGDAE